MGSKHECEVCLQEFTRSERVREHYEAVHHNMHYVCSICGYCNRWKRSVIQHLRSKHEKSPPYKPLMIKRKADDYDNSKTTGSLHFDPPIDDMTNNLNDSPNDIPLNLAKRDRSDHHNNHRNNDDDDSIKLNGPKDYYLKLSDDDYHCKSCEKSSSNAQEAAEHYETFHLNMEYVCQLCKFSDISRNVVGEHLKRKHRVGKPYDIFIKRIEMDSFRNVRRNQNLERNFVLLVQQLLRSEPSLSPSNERDNDQNNSIESDDRSSNAAEDHQPKIEDNNMGKQYTNVNNQLKCKICWSLFTSLQGFQEHYEAIHMDIIWTCRRCSHSFRWRQQLTKHLKMIHRCEPPFNEYMIKETGSYKLKRPIPEKSPHAAYARRPSLPKSKYPKNLSSSSNNNSPDGNVDCEEDSGKLSSSTSLLSSRPFLPSMYPDLTTCMPGVSFTEEPLIVASETNGNTNDKGSTLKNYVFCDNQFSCKLCQSVFSSLQGFQEHYEAIHLNIVYACKLCGFENRWRPQVTTHLKRSHNCEPPYGDHMYKRKSSKASPNGGDKEVL